jgi:kumamolisin
MSYALYKSSAAIAVLAAIAASNAWAASPATDIGHTSDSQAITLTVALPLRDQATAEAMMVRMVTPGDALYGKFMTPEQVESQFGPSEADVQQVSSVFTAAGLSVTRTSSATLSVSGSVGTVERVFQTSVHQFATPANAHSAGYTFHAAASRPVVPSAIAGKVQSVVGFSNAPVFRSHKVRSPPQIGASPIQRLPQSSNSGGSNLSARFGMLTVLDFDQQYDVNPLLNAGINGKGRTIGIVTLASFTTSDAFTYWNSLGLKTNTNRISIVNIDGGAGPISDMGGSDETTLDVQQSGGIAPGANIIVYEAPNSSQAFLDAFVKAISDNRADAVSTSFGLPEIFDGEVDLNGSVTDPRSGEQVSFLQALHPQLVIAALQGQSLSTAAGDSGAYDVVRDFGVDDGFTDPLSVDYPASDPAITAAGGTTLPGPQSYLVNGKTLTINNPVERVWGWDYLEPLCGPGTPTQEFLFQCGIFSVGTGGGVSSFFTLPIQQLLIVGTQLSQPGQKFIENDVSPSQDLFDFPAFFPGRNVPDVSFNADPQTGYEVPYTSSVSGFGIDEAGGTSFVAPQLAGVTVLLDEKTGHRVGLLSALLYNLERVGASFGPAPAIRTISTGDNWFYKGRQGYSPAVGVGTLDVSNLARITF